MTIRFNDASMTFTDARMAEAFFGRMVERIDADGTGWVQSDTFRYEDGRLSRLGA